MKNLSFHEKQNNGHIKPFVLIHGAWYTSHCWHYLKDQLSGYGHKVVAISLPNYTLSGKPQEEITLDTYVQFVIDEILNLESKPVIVGHSMAGIILSQLASDFPDKVEALVYLSAFLLQNGESITDFIGRRANTETGAIKFFVNIKGKNGKKFQAWKIDNNTIKERFHSDVDNIPKDSFYPITPYLPIDTPLKLSKKFHTIPKHYVTCRNDMAITFKEQNQMLLRARLAHKNVSYFSSTNLNSSHSPFFLEESSQKLAAFLHNYSNEINNSRFESPKKSRFEKLQNHTPVKIGIIKGKGIGPIISDIFAEYLKSLDALSSISTHLILENENFYHSYDSINTEIQKGAHSTDISHSEANLLFETYSNWFQNEGVKVVFRTSINAEALYLFRQEARVIKEFCIRTRFGRKILIVRDQSEGFYANTQCHITPEKVIFKGEFTQAHHQEMIRTAHSIGKKCLAKGYETWALYKFHLFGVSLKNWFTKIDKSIKLFQPDTGLLELFRNYIFQGTIKNDLLLICSNEVGDLIFELLAGALNLDPKYELYSRNILLAPPFFGDLLEYQTVHGSADDLIIKNRLSDIRPDPTLRIAADIAEKFLGYNQIVNLTENALVKARMNKIAECNEIVRHVINSLRKCWKPEFHSSQKLNSSSSNVSNLNSTLHISQIS